MTRQVWQIERFSADVTDDVMSFTYSTGRQTQFDSYSPGSLVLTIRNESGQANSYDLNDKIILNAIGGLDWYQWFYVQEVFFNDMPGTGAGSTATVICTDLLGRCGRIQVFEQVIGSQQTMQQIDTEFESLLPLSTRFEVFNNGDSTAAADASYTGTVLNRLNLNMVTEQGYLALSDVSIYLYARSDLQLLAPGVITFARSASGSFQLGYSNIERIALGSNYLNTCSVTPPVAAQQNVSDPTGVSTYGIYGAEFSTVDNSATQAQSFAQWQVYSRADPDELSFQISISDTANNLVEFFNAVFSGQHVVTVLYKNPGDATTYTSSQIMQGWSMSVTPAATNIQVFTSPLTYTNFFTLNSDTFGVLNTSRLGW
tara:strand:- start:465 stop:1577 length:1113 start_codon:yes stop_codon:yes gene_type:complete